MTLIPGWARSATNAQLRLGEPREVPDVIQPPFRVLGKSLRLQRVVGALDCVSSPLPGVLGLPALPGSSDLLVPRSAAARLRCWLLVWARMNSQTARRGCAGVEQWFGTGFSQGQPGLGPPRPWWRNGAWRCREEGKVPRVQGSCEHPWGKRWAAGIPRGRSLATALSL